MSQLCVPVHVPKVTNGLHQHFLYPRIAAPHYLGQLLRRQGCKVTHSSACILYQKFQHLPINRDAVFRVLEVEQPQAVVLNYAPGPLDTPMVKDLLEDQRTDPGRSYLLRMTQMGRFVNSSVQL